MLTFHPLDKIDSDNDSDDDGKVDNNHMMVGEKGYDTNHPYMETPWVSELASLLLDSRGWIMLIYWKRTFVPPFY